MFTVSMSAQKIRKAYENTPLPTILKELNTAQDEYQISFIYDELADFKITATINAKNAREAIEQATVLYPIRISTYENMLLVECEKTTHRLIGYVCDASNQPVEYANIALLSLTDSTFITGGVSNESGRFVIPCDTDVAIMRVSYVGMKTLMRKVNIRDIGTIRMLPDQYTLRGVTVKAKTVRKTSEGLTVTVKGTSLGKLGFAADVLQHLPLIKAQDDGYTVIGKGTPIIYVNNRLVRDNEELKQINSDEIKNVSIITNPGAEYDATVNAVIRITTDRPAGEGIGGLFNAGVSAERKWSHNAAANLTYRKGGLDIGASLRYDKNKGIADQTTTRTHGERMEIDTTRLLNNQFIWRATTSINYLWKDKFATGARYQYMGMPSAHFDCYDKVEALKGGTRTNRIAADDYREEHINRHYLNAYANYNFNDETFLKLDADLLSGNTTNSQDYRLNNEAVITNTRSDNQLYAARLTFATPLLSGTVKLGADASYTNNKNRYTVNDETTLANQLQSSANEAKQNLFAAFAQYERNFGERWSASIGGRLESVKFDYFINGQKSDEVSRTYNGFYPSASVAYTSGDIQLSLAYRYTTRRPSYFQLRSEVAFNNPYSYEGGSPELQPQKTNMISFTAQWKDLLFSADYSFIKNRIVYVQEMYNSSDSISLFHTRNLDNCRLLNLTVVYSPTLFKIWKPVLTVNMAKPRMTYNGQRYSKPIFDFDFDNSLELPRQFIIGLDLDYNTAGNADDDLCYNYANLYTSAYCIKSFLGDRLRLKLSTTNFLNTYREKWRKETNGISLEKWNDRGKCTVMFTVSYRINNQHSKYRGKASTDELNRL